MRLSDLHYDLPPELIAQQPAARRDGSRLLVLHRDTGRIEHRVFGDLLAYLEPGDALVLNDTRVIPARFFARRATGGLIEGLFIHADEAGWHVLLKPSVRLRVGEQLACVAKEAHAAHATSSPAPPLPPREGSGESPESAAETPVSPPRPSGKRGVATAPSPSIPPALNPCQSVEEGWHGLSPREEPLQNDRSHTAQPGSATACYPALRLVARGPRGAWTVRPEPTCAPLQLLQAIGHPPLPPYIHRSSAAPPAQEAADTERYQTVYATQPGAVAAPTAGLHFTPELLDAAVQRGVAQVRVTLHVGPGTFAPIEAEELSQHVMHAEWYALTAGAAAQLNAARLRGGRIVAVGTTSTRVLESLPPGSAIVPASGWTRVFIYPPYRVRHVDRLVTNFHLPGSTLLALVMAVASPALIRKAYAAAIAERYRFYSYGDAMLII